VVFAIVESYAAAGELRKPHSQEWLCY
jgi:hypothetical protein